MPSWLLDEEAPSSGESDLSSSLSSAYFSDDSAEEEASFRSDIMVDYALLPESPIVESQSTSTQPLVTPDLRCFQPTLSFDDPSFVLAGMNVYNDMNLDDQLEFEVQLSASETDDDVVNNMLSNDIHSRSGPARRRKSPKHKPSLSPYPSPPVSPGPSSPSSDNSRHTKAGRSGHVSGVNRKTGELTLVGRFPPIEGGIDEFYCPHPLCHKKRGGRYWGTKNGYKYHLINNCFRNPESNVFKKLAAGEKSQKAKTNAIVATCECGQLFRSENGYRMHLEQNKTTHSGQCVERMRRRMERQEAHRTRAASPSMSELFSHVLDGDVFADETGISEQGITNL